MGEDFRLKWNDHHNVFFSTAEQLCNGDHLTDVTLSCGEKEFAAHKLVLSICSSYFSQLFAPRPDRDDTRRRNAETIVYLKDVDARHMELLMNYMYRGEINVEENELMGLLATAKSLQIKGLTESEEDDTKSSNQGSYSEPSAVTPRPTVSKKRPAPKPLSTSAVPTPSTSSGSSLPAKKIKHDIKQEEIQIQPEVVSADPFQAEDETGPEQAEEYLEADDPNLELESHDYNLDTSQGAESMAYEGDPNNPGNDPIMLGPTSFACPYCSKIMSSKRDIRRHLLHHTGETPHICPYCSRGFTQKCNMDRHIKRVHS